MVPLCRVAAGCIVVSCSAFLLLLLERRGARWLEALFGAVIGMEAIAMSVNFFRAGVPAKEVALGLFRPTLPANAIVPAVGALGALVMPYNLFFSSAVVMSRRPSPPTRGRVREVLWYHRLETPLILLGTFIINMFVICVFATGFYGTDQEIGLQSAGDLLAERFGSEFKLFWALGLLAAGQVSTIALTYAGQLIMAGMLRIEVQGWKRMVCTRMVALVPALAGKFALATNASNSFDRLNQMLNVVQSIQLPFALIPAIHMAANRAIMTPVFATSKFLTTFCSLIALAVVSVNGYFLVTFRQDNLPGGAGVTVGWAFLMTAYYISLAYYAVSPTRLHSWVSKSWLGPRLHRAQTSVAVAGSATARAAGGLVTWAKGINWRDPESLLEVHL
ncbi:Metal transporter Nramp6 [Chlorella vulgaris]